MLSYAGMLLLASMAVGQDAKPTMMPTDLRKQIDERLIGEWTYEVTWGEKKYIGEETTRWIGRKMGILIQGHLMVDGKRTGYVMLQGWDGNANAIVGRGFTSDGEASTGCWTDFSKEKWTGHGEGMYQGKKWESPSKLEFLKDSQRYEDTTHGKPWIAVYKRKSAPAEKTRGSSVSGSERGSVPKAVLEQLEFMVGSWKETTADESAEGAPERTLTHTRKWAPGKHCVVVAWSGLFDGEKVDGTGVVGWSRKTNELTERWYMSDGTYFETCYPIDKMKGNSWEGTTSWEEPDGRIINGTCRLTKQGEDEFVWIVEWKEGGKTKTQKATNRRMKNTN